MQFNSHLLKGKINKNIVFGSILHASNSLIKPHAFTIKVILNIVYSNSTYGAISGIFSHKAIAFQFAVDVPRTSITAVGSYWEKSYCSSGFQTQHDDQDGLMREPGMAGTTQAALKTLVNSQTYQTVLYSRHRQVSEFMGQ